MGRNVRYYWMVLCRVIVTLPADHVDVRDRNTRSWPNMTVKPCKTLKLGGLSSCWTANFVFRRRRRSCTIRRPHALREVLIERDKDMSP